MNRGVKAILFVLVATAANILATLVYFVALLALYGITLARVLAPSAAAPAFLVAFVLAVVLAALTYNRVLKLLRARKNLEEWLGPQKRTDGKPRARGD